MDDPQLQKQLEVFTPEYQEIIRSDEPTILARTFGKVFELSEHDETVLENSIRLYLMGLHDTDGWIDFVAEFTGLDIMAAQVVVTEMQKYIADDIKTQLEELRSGSLSIESEQTNEQMQQTDETPTPEHTQEQETGQGKSVSDIPVNTQQETDIPTNEDIQPQTSSELTQTEEEKDERSFVHTEPLPTTQQSNKATQELVPPQKSNNTPPTPITQKEKVVDQPTDATKHETDSQQQYNNTSSKGNTSTETEVTPSGQPTYENVNQTHEQTKVEDTKHSAPVSGIPTKVQQEVD